MYFWGSVVKYSPYQPENIIAADPPYTRLSSKCLINIISYYHPNSLGVVYHIFPTSLKGKTEDLGNWETCLLLSDSSWKRCSWDSSCTLVWDSCYREGYWFWEGESVFLTIIIQHLFLSAASPPKVNRRPWSEREWDALSMLASTRLIQEFQWEHELPKVPQYSFTSVWAAGLCKYWAVHVWGKWSNYCHPWKGPSIRESVVWYGK